MGKSSTSKVNYSILNSPVRSVSQHSFVGIVNLWREDTATTTVMDRLLTQTSERNEKMNPKRPAMHSLQLQVMARTAS